MPRHVRLPGLAYLLARQRQERATVTFDLPDLEHQLGRRLPRGARTSGYWGRVVKTWPAERPGRWVARVTRGAELQVTFHWYAGS